MTTTDNIVDLIERTRGILGDIDATEPDLLNAHPAGHPNSIAWLLWHTGREIDAQLSALSGAEERWTAGGHREKFGLGEIGDSIGYGHSEGEARDIAVDKRDLLNAYVTDAFDALTSYVNEVGDWEAIVDEQYDPPVTRQARVVSIIMDAAQHLAQAQYVAGAPEL